ncbi:MAG TPA: hypothetical protein VK717_05275 [Opitutaceae bacterium]|nr:hypothetical protein [Opitutaceae bacterium]
MILGYFVAHQKTEITQAKADVTQVHLQWSVAEKDEQKRILELQHQLTAAREAEILAEKQIAQQKQDMAALAPSKGEGANETGSANGGGTIIHIGDILKDHPEYAALYAKQMRRNVDRMYGTGLDTLNLAPDQLSKLKDLLTERQMSNIDAQQLATAAGLERGSPAWQDAMKQAAQDTEQQITTILGSNADATLTQLQARTGMQNQVNGSYASDFADAGVPLTPAQASGLVQAMADANYAGKDTSTRPAGYNTPDPTTGLTPHDNRIINSAALVLSPAQVQILKTDQIENRQIAAIMKQYNKSGGPVMFVP